jgi:hypothetical protein
MGRCRVPIEGFVLCAFYWQPGWTDSTKITYWTDPPVPDSKSEYAPLLWL